MRNRMPSGCFFVILFEGRTGSSYTVSALNIHPDVLCYPEILVDRDRVTQRRVMEGLVTGYSVERIDPRVLDERYFRDHPNTKKDPQAVGLKTKLHHIFEVANFYSLLRFHGFKLIYLKRRNIVKSVISYLNAERLRRGHGASCYNAVSPHQVQGAIHIRPGLFERELQRRIKLEIGHEEFFAACELEKRVFYYEDLLQDWEAFWASLLDYLDLDLIPAKGRFFKNTPDRLSEAIQNHGEIRSLFTGTCLEHFFDE